MKFLRPDIIISQSLVANPLLYTTSIGRKFKLERIIFHASVAITETITITHISKQGTTYNSVMRVKSLSSESDFVFVPEDNTFFLDGDEIRLQCTNANITGTLYCTIKTSETSV